MWAVAGWKSSAQARAARRIVDFGKYLRQVGMLCILRSSKYVLFKNKKMLQVEASTVLPMVTQPRRANFAVTFGDSVFKLRFLEGQYEGFKTAGAYDLQLRNEECSLRKLGSAR